MKKNKKKGFTLIELLAVIVVLAVILLIAVPQVIKQIQKTKQKAFYTSVSNLVDNIKPENVIDQKDYCMYDYSQDTVNKTENIDEMYVLAHMEDNKIIYSVYAKKEGQPTINVYNFNKLDIDKPSSWEEGIGEKSSYTFYLTKLYLDLTNDGTIINGYTKCGVAK